MGRRRKEGACTRRGSQTPAFLATHQDPPLAEAGQESVLVWVGKSLFPSPLSLPPSLHSSSSFSLFISPFSLCLCALTVLTQLARHYICTRDTKAEETCPSLHGTFRLGDLGWGGTSFIHSFINFTFIENLLRVRHCARPWGRNGVQSLPTRSLEDKRHKSRQWKHG